jgi:hypothetical protein
MTHSHPSPSEPDLGPLRALRLRGIEDDILIIEFLQENAAAESCEAIDSVRKNVWQVKLVLRQSQRFITWFSGLLVRGKGVISNATHFVSSTTSQPGEHKLDMSSFAIRIIFLLLPGAIGATLYWKLKGRTTRKDWEDFLEVIIFSVASYLLYALCTYFLGFFNFIWNKLGLQAKTFTQFHAFFDESATLDLSEIFYVSLLSVPLAILASYSYRYRWLNKLGQKIGATIRLRDEDVWDFFHTSRHIRENWVTIRDHKLTLYYFGWIEAFSDSGKERELILREVDVYNSAGERLYKTDVMYLSRKPDELTIEAAIAFNEIQGRGQQENGRRRIRKTPKRK